VGEMRNEYKILVGSLKVRLGRHRRRWENNIRLHLWERVCECVDWIHLIQNRGLWQDLVNTVMNIRVP